MIRSRLLPALALLLALAAIAPAQGAASRGDDVRLNDVQVIGTHNSYKRETSRPEQATYESLIQTPGDYGAFLGYSHASIANQLDRQGMRGLELDLFPDPKGGLYANPLVRQRLGLGPQPDPAWRTPGIKTLHIADFDYNTTCVRFVDCLTSVRRFSRANPRHLPLLVMLELKGSDSRAVKQGGVTAPPWDASALAGLDREIRSVFTPRDLITPDDVRRPGRTLEQSVLQRGWPTLRDSRGKVLFLMDNEAGPIQSAYLAGRPSLEGRVLFTNGTPGRPDAAFVKRNEPRTQSGVDNGAAIRSLVRRGYLVRTRADIPLETVLANDFTQLDAAIRSGAQLVSTDFPQVGMSARYGSDYVGRFPDGSTFRCDPVVAPRGCRSRELEQPRRAR